MSAPNQFLRSREQVRPDAQMPAVSTLISVVDAHDDQQHERGERQRDAVVEADGRWCAARSVVAQRPHCAVMPGASAGTVCSSPQPGHSRSCGSVTSGSDAVREQRITVSAQRSGEHRREPVGELADRGADRRDLALRCPLSGGVTTKRKLRSHRPGAAP